MAVCVRCKKEVGLVGSLLSFNKQTGRCSSCENHIRQELNRFRQAFIKYCEDGILSPQEWQYLQAGSAQGGLDWNEALRFVVGDALRFLERTLTFAASDGIITDEEERYFHELRQQLQLLPELTKSLVERLDYLKQITKIRQGNLPTLQPSVHLEADELCHLETPAVYQKVKTNGIQPIPGRLLATNKKLHFLSNAGGWNILWKNVMRVEAETLSVYIELSTKKGNGRYQVSDAVLTEATLNAITRIAKRQLLVPSDETESRHIPQDVKLAVWQRDQGKCVQCGATSYLEFDHIIPFSKGGASTVNNVQLLCRKCNLAKGDRL